MARPSPLAREIDALLDEWRDDPDMTTAEFTLVQIEQVIDRLFGRKERQHGSDE